MDPKSCRYEIRKAEKMLDKIAVRRNEASVEQDFLHLYRSFVRAKGHAPPLSRRRLREYLRTCDLWMVYFDGQPVCGHLVAFSVGTPRVRLLYSASSRFAGSDNARISGPLNRYLHWVEFQHYQQCGIELYDFGGVGDGTSSIAKFKLSFGGARMHDYSYVFAGTLGRLAHSLHRVLIRVRTAW
jgi:hypothetical protein